MSQKRPKLGAKRIIVGPLVFVLAPSLLLIAAGTALSESGYKPSPITKVVLLGTGTPGPIPDRSGPCVAIVVNDTPYLVDLGPGVVRRASAAYRKGVPGLHFSKLKTAFVTHLHSDHTVGYPDFIFTPWVVGRTGPVQVYGPSGIKAMTDHILEAWKEDIKIRTEGLERNFPEHNDTGYKVDVREISPGVVYQDRNVTVNAFPVSHGEVPQAFGYRFATPDRTIVISGDTSPSQNVIDNCNGCDVLVHEVYTMKGHAAAAPSWQAYQLKYHTSSKQLAELATKARPKLLVLYHQIYLFNTSTREDLLQEMRDAYKGAFVSGLDLEIY
jgi:ribonuclease BN (tRNA processing enzyme)